jgi:hypothetical protein
LKWPSLAVACLPGHAGFCTKGMNEWSDEVLAFLAKPGG